MSGKRAASAANHSSISSRCSAVGKLSIHAGCWLPQMSVWRRNGNPLSLASAYARSSSVQFIESRTLSTLPHFAGVLRRHLVPVRGEVHDLRRTVNATEELGLACGDRRAGRHKRRRWRLGRPRQAVIELEDSKEGALRAKRELVDPEAVLAARNLKRLSERPVGNAEPGDGWLSAVERRELDPLPDARRRRARRPPPCRWPACSRPGSRGRSR